MNPIPRYHLRILFSHNRCLLTLEKRFRLRSLHMPHDRLDLVGEMGGQTGSSWSGERAGVIRETRSASVHSLENDRGRCADWTPPVWMTHL